MTIEPTADGQGKDETLRAEWHSPEVRRIDASQAEQTVAGAGDALAIS